MQADFKVLYSAQKRLLGLVEGPVHPCMFPMDSQQQLGLRQFVLWPDHLRKLEIFSRTLKGMSERMSSQETLTMVEMAPGWWEYEVRRIRLG